MDPKTEQPVSAIRRITSGLSAAVRQVLRVLVMIPAMAARVGVVVGKLLSSSSTAVARGSDKARVAMANAQVKAARTAREAQKLAREIEVQPPRVTTKDDRRRQKVRRIGRGAMFAGVAAGIGAGVAFVLRRRRDEEMGEELAPWDPAAPPVVGDSDGLDGDRVIDVTAAEH